MKYTISDIAHMANVSKATVSRVLNHKNQGVGPQTKERIQNIIDELGYLPNSQARSIVFAQTKTIGLVIPDIANPFFPQMVRGIIQCAAQNGYTVFLADSGNSPECEIASVRSLSERRVDGIILSPVSLREDALHLCIQNNLPVVQIDRVAGQGGASVTINNRLGMQKATALLLRNGHRHIAFLGGPQTVSTTRQRFEGYCDTLSAAGVKPRREYALFGQFSIVSGIEMTKQLLNDQPQITGIIACNDLLAIGTVKALTECRISVPDQCEIIGFDGIELADVFDPAITTVRQPIDKMAQEAAGLLLRIITGTAAGEQHIVFDPMLDCRQTTKQPAWAQPAGTNNKKLLRWHE